MRLPQMLLPQGPQGDTIHVRNEWNKKYSHVSGMLHFCLRALCAFVILSSIGMGASSSVAAQGKLKATVTAHSVTLTWIGSATAGVSYNVYRGTAVVGNVSALTYTDATVTAGTAYSYSVTALCVSCAAGITGESIHTNTVTVTIPTNPVPPNPPTGLSGTVAVIHTATQDQIVATWSDIPNLPTSYTFFSTTNKTILLRSSKGGNAKGTYAATWTGTSQAAGSGSIVICDSNIKCIFLNFVG